MKKHKGDKHTQGLRTQTLDSCPFCGSRDTIQSQEYIQNWKQGWRYCRSCCQGYDPNCWYIEQPVSSTPEASYDRMG